MDIYPADEINGQALYPIGGGSWILEETEK
jgi:hypothetical protein